jgi:competence protein ComEC
LGTGALLVGIALEHLTYPHRIRLTQLTFLAVGQGDCAVFQHKGYTLLFDAGPKTPYIDSGERIVVKELARLGVRSIDLALLSHPDMDHVGGLTAILRRFHVSKICVPACFAEDTAMRKLLKEGEASPAQIYWLKGRASTQIGDFLVDMYAPPIEKSEKDNEGSMFVQLRSGNCSALFTGDAGILKEIQMLPFRKSWQSQVLKAGHHGSQGSTGDAWLQAVKPKYVILSCGRRNAYGHPHRATLRRIEAVQACPLRTDILGNIRFKPGPKGFEWIR